MGEQLDRKGLLKYYPGLSVSVKVGGVLQAWNQKELKIALPPQEDDGDVACTFDKIILFVRGLSLAFCSSAISL